MKYFTRGLSRKSAGAQSFFSAVQVEKMYGMGFDGADDALGVLATAAGAPAPAAAPAAAGGAPVHAHGAHAQEDYVWLATLTFFARCRTISSGFSTPPHRPARHPHGTSATRTRIRRSAARRAFTCIARSYPSAPQAGTALHSTTSAMLPIASALPHPILSAGRINLCVSGQGSMDPGPVQGGSNRAKGVC